MNKVICIDNKPRGADWPLLHMLSVGSEYTIAETVYNGEGVVLVETYKEQYEQGQAFRASRFAPLSDIDETIIHEQQLELTP